MTYFCPALDPPLDGSGRKTTTLVRDLEYFIHTKFHQNPSSSSGEEVENVNSLTDDGRRTDGRRTTDAGQRVITIGHWSLWLLCPKNGNRRYKFLVLGRKGPYFVKEHSDSKHKYTEDDIINMLDFLVDNIFVVFGGKVFQQIVGIPMGTNCAPLLTDVFLYSYEAEFIQSLLSTGKKIISISVQLHIQIHR